MGRERLITVARDSTDNIKIKRTIITRKKKWEKKQHYDYFKKTN